LKGRKAPAEKEPELVKRSSCLRSVQRHKSVIRETVRSEPMIPLVLLFGRGGMWMAVEAEVGVVVMAAALEKKGA
jgi:hypothetical protein